MQTGMDLFKFHDKKLPRIYSKILPLYKIKTKIFPLRKVPKNMELSWYVFSHYHSTA